MDVYVPRFKSVYLDLLAENFFTFLSSKFASFRFDFFNLQKMPAVSHGDKVSTEQTKE